jgi:hypothetical protein
VRNIEVTSTSSLDGSTGSGDAGVVHEHIDAAEVGERRRHERIDRAGVSHVGDHPIDAIERGHRRQSVGVDVAGPHGSASCGERLRHRAADPGASGGDDHPQIGEVQLHGVTARGCRRRTR